MANATWKNNTVEFIQWTGNNLYEVEEFVEKASQGTKIFISTDGSNEIYVIGVGIVRQNDYLYKSGNYTYSPILVSSWKVFPHIVNEDIRSGLEI